MYGSVYVRVCGGVSVCEGVWGVSMYGGVCMGRCVWGG